MKTRIFFPLLILFFLSAYGYAANLDVNSVNYEPAPVVPGQYFDLWVNIVNTTKYDSTDVVFELGLDYPFSLEPAESAKKEIAGIKAYQLALVKYKVYVAPGALGGKYKVNLKIGDYGETQKTIPYYIDVKGGTPKIELIDTSTTRIAPGAERAVGLTLKNIGRADAADIIVKIDAGQGTQILPLGATTQYISSIEAGKQAVVEFTLSASSTSTLSTYVVPVTITYSNAAGNETFATTSSIGLKISDEPDLDVVIGSAVPVPAAGRNSEISFDLFNIGSGTAKFLVVELQSDNATFPDNKIFIGTLDSDDFDSFKTTATFDRNISEKRVPIKVVFNFKNENNETKTIEKTVFVELAGNGNENGASGLVGLASFTIPLGIIIVIVAAIAYFFVVRPKQQKQKK